MRLVAWLVAAGETPVPPEELRRRLLERLPPASIPSSFRTVPALPLTANGKVDRRALAALSGGPLGPTSEFEAPASFMEQQLARIWQQLLGVETIGVNDDFFDLGGSSLLAMHMLDRIEERFRIRLLPSFLLSRSTLRELGAALLETIPEPAPLIALQPEGTRPPFYFLHGDYVGAGLYCANLVRHLDPDQPLYLLPPLGLDGDPVPDSYQAMAVRHLEVLQGHQPTGPYRLGGHCNGGLVAFELARLLQQQGEEIERLVLIGSSASNLRFRPLHSTLERIGRAIGPGPEARAELFDQLRALWITLETLPAGRRLGYLASKAARVPAVLAQVFAAGRRNPEVTPGATWATDLRDAYLRIDRSYLPEPLPLPISLIWPDDDPETPAEAAGWWQRICPEVELLVIPGSHVSCQLDHIEAYAAAIRSSLHGKGS